MLLILDELELPVDNGHLPPLEIEDDAPLNQRDRNEIKREIATAIDAVKPIYAPTRTRRFMNSLKDWGAISALWSVPLALLAMVITVAIFAANQQSTISSKLSGIDGQFSKINQRLDGIEGKIASQTVVSQSSLPPAQFKSSLPALGDAIATVRRNKVAVSNGILDDLQQKLISTDDGVPGYWNAAGELISYRASRVQPAVIPSELAAISGPPAPTTDADCFAGKLTRFDPEGTAPADTEVINMHDCTIRLDDLQAFNHRSVDQHIAPSTAIIVNLVRVHVLYSGGQLIPVARINFYDCALDFHIPESPVPQGQRFVQMFLAESFDGARLSVSVPS